MKYELPGSNYLIDPRPFVFSPVTHLFIPGHWLALLGCRLTHFRLLGWLQTAGRRLTFFAFCLLVPIFACPGTIVIEYGFSSPRSSLIVVFMFCFLFSACRFGVPSSVSSASLPGALQAVVLG